MARIPYPAREQLEAETAAALDGMKPMNIFRMLARADGLAPTIFDTTTRLFTRGRTTLPARLRQVAILRVAGAGGYDYLVAHHEPISARVGLSAMEIAAILGGHHGELGEQERAVGRFAEESTLTGDVSDAAFDAVRAFLGDRELVELSVVVGLYNCLGRVLKALRIETEEKA
jgi:4-carboxymuconolactone decarboxylase